MEQRARVVAEYRAHYDIALDGKVYQASVRGSFHENADSTFPKVGDYVTVMPTNSEQYVITAIEPRRNVLTRRLTFDDTTQEMVANVDQLLIVMGLDKDYNLRRLKRYLALAEQNHVIPIVILTKTDIADDLAAKVSEVTTTVPSDVPVLSVSSITGEGVSTVADCLQPNTTSVLLGSSGAGKSSLTNALFAAEVMDIGDVRHSDERGRHTTTRRQLFTLPNGAALIDTPGMRELAMDNEAASAEAAYPEMAALAEACRFRNCDHDKSAGCALQAAVAAGEVSEADVAAFLKLRNRVQRHRRTRGMRYTKKK